MYQQKRNIIIIIAVVSAIVVIGIIIGIMCLATDMFKSSELLFSKYFIQNFEIFKVLKNETNSEIDEYFETNPYNSEIGANIKYTENIGTSDENTKSGINKIGVKLTNSVDRKNEYYYRDISIGTQAEDLLKMEILNDNQAYALRLNGIKQFVSTDNLEESKKIKAFQVYQMEDTLKQIETTKMISFSEEEKNTLRDTYTNIIQSNITKEKYSKQRNTLITINNQDVQTNAYSIKLTIEEYNNIYIKILEQIKQDKIILSKIDEIDNLYNKILEEDETLKDIFIDYIQKTIEKIQNNNIGNDEVKITVYESKGKTVRTSIERTANKITLDLYNETSFKINQLKLEETTEERFLNVEKNNSNLLVEFKDIQDNEVTKHISLNYQDNFTNDNLDRMTEIQIANQKYEAIFTIKYNVSFVEELQNKVTLEEDNIRLDELQQEHIDILNQNLEEQLSSLSEQVMLKDYRRMLENIGLVRQSTIKLPGNRNVTEVERKRFNSQFEFFASSNLTKDNIKTLIQTVSNNFDDMKVLLKDGTIEDLDLDKLTANSQNAKEYKESIAEILISIKEGSTNTKKEEDILKYLEDNQRETYTVSLEYDDDGLVRIARIKIEDET